MHAILRRHAGERRKLHEEAEERQRQAGGAPDSIDSLLKLGLSVTSLLKLNMREASAEDPSSKEDAAHHEAAAKPAASGGAEPSASAADPQGAAAAGVAAPSRPASRTPARHLLLAKQLRFGDMTQQVGLTKHCLMQLQMLDVPRRAAALRLLHCLGSDRLENQEARDAPCTR